ncbi:hypothetical protein BDA96_02G396200 [Sorghum bicolor]|jgi:hypothetical protein|uniref:Uncharacterized protein n=2 Tax=Sorghum bicolor TaxID=4558 RepID=A0A921RSH7_SORBI|nr:periplakin [Sorghum bicolor]EER97552.1 hypothetical protein SORBI_3002G377700 [Sorghum bicolor]KAG0545834.1 hypothetical protein BDA96_02G396200 [Sorghum bicolor]|eukprot:XP_002461031.1 periplakin [Sorghum bicolor]
MKGNNQSPELPPSTTTSVLKELSGTREEVERAREAAVQAWLASMPLSEELERLRAELVAAKTRLAATAAEIPLLKSQIESTNGAIATRQEAAARKKAAAEDLRRHVDGARADLRRLRAEIAASRGAKDALEQRVLVRRQAARALQLAERAIAAEAHALAWSEAAASELTARARGNEEDPHYDVVALPARKLEELRRLVEAEEQKAEARVDEAEVARRAVKTRRAAAVARLDAARAKRRVAAEATLGRRANGDDGRGTRARSALVPKSRSGRSCFEVKKLRRFLCNLTKD